MPRSREATCLEGHRAFFDFRQRAEDDWPYERHDPANALEEAAFRVQAARALGREDRGRSVDHGRNRLDRRARDERDPLRDATSLQVRDELTGTRGQIEECDP